LEGGGIEHEDKLLIRDEHFLFLVFEVHEKVPLGEFCLDEFGLSIESHQFSFSGRLYGKELAAGCEYHFSGGEEGANLGSNLSF